MTTKKPTNKDVEAWANGHQAGPINQTASHRGGGKPVVAATKEEATRKRFTVNLRSDLIEWARQAVVFTPGLSLSGLVEEALGRELKRMVKERGEAFPTTTATPKKGRPIVLKGD